MVDPVGLRLAWLAGTEEGVKLGADTLALVVGVVGVQENGAEVDLVGLFLLYLKATFWVILP